MHRSEEENALTFLEKHSPGCSTRELDNSDIEYGTQILKTGKSLRRYSVHTELSWQLTLLDTVNLQELMVLLQHYSKKKNIY